MLSPNPRKSKYSKNLLSAPNSHEILAILKLYCSVISVSPLIRDPPEMLRLIPILIGSNWSQYLFDENLCFV